MQLGFRILLSPRRNVHDVRRLCDLPHCHLVHVLFLCAAHLGLDPVLQVEFQEMVETLHAHDRVGLRLYLPLLGVLPRHGSFSVGTRNQHTHTHTPNPCLSPSGRQVCNPPLFPPMRFVLGVGWPGGGLDGIVPPGHTAQPQASCATQAPAALNVSCPAAE